MSILTSRLGRWLALSGMAYLLFWALAGNAVMGPAGQTAQAVLRALVVERNLDLLPGLAFASPECSGPVTGVQPFPSIGSALGAAPLFSWAHLASATTDRWPPDGTNPLYPAALSLSCGIAVLFGLGVLSRAGLRLGAGPGLSLVAAVAFLLATRLVQTAVLEPDPVRAFTFAASSTLCALWIARPGLVALPATLVGALALVDPVGVSWAVLLLPALAGPGRLRTRLARPILAVGLMALAFAPQLLVWAARGDEGPVLSVLRDLLARDQLGCPTGPARILELADAVLAQPILLAAGAGLLALAFRELRLAWAVVALAVTVVLHLHRGSQPCDAGLSVNPLMALGWIALASRARRSWPLLLAVTMVVLVVANLVVILAPPAGPSAPGAGPLARLCVDPGGALAARFASGTRHVAPAALAIGVVPWGKVILAVGLLSLVTCELAMMTLAPRAILAALIVLLALGTGLTARACLDATGPGRLAWRAPGAVLDDASTTVVFRPGPGVSGDVLLAVTRIEDAAGVAIGDEAGRIVVCDPHGRRFEFCIVVGYDTAPGRPEGILGRGRRALMATTVARYRYSGVERTALEFDHAYLKRCHLPFRTPVSEIWITRTGTRCRLVVEALALRW